MQDATLLQDISNVAGLLRPSDRILVVGGRNSNFPKELRKCVRLIFWDSLDKTSKTKEVIPAGVKVVLCLRYIKHPLYDKIKVMCERQEVLMLPELYNTGQANRKLKELLAARRLPSPQAIQDEPMPQGRMQSLRHMIAVHARPLLESNIIPDLGEMANRVHTHLTDRGIVCRRELVTEEISALVRQDEATQEPEEKLPALNQSETALRSHRSNGNGAHKDVEEKHVHVSLPPGLTSCTFRSTEEDSSVLAPKGEMSLSEAAEIVRQFISHVDILKSAVDVIEKSCAMHTKV